MARPSQNIDKKLIELGKKRLMEHGISSISIRAICMESGINLGMFHYYFKSKENFIRILFNSMNEDMSNYWTRESAGLANSKEKLKKVLFINAKIMKEQRGTFETIIKDIDIFDDFYVQLGKEMHKKFTEFYNDLINGCKEEGFLKKEIENDKYIAIFTGSAMDYAKHNLDEEGEKYFEKVQRFIDELADMFMLK